MKFTFVPMTDQQAGAIAKWKYGGIYAFYNMAMFPDDVVRLMDHTWRDGRMFAALADNGSLAGFFEFVRDDQARDVVELGLGLRPDLTGRGLGLGFVCAGLEFSREMHTPRTFRLKVWVRNERAIRVYERAGFQRVRSFTHQTDRGDFPFVEMNRSA